MLSSVNVPILVTLTGSIHLENKHIVALWALWNFCDSKVILILRNILEEEGFHMTANLHLHDCIISCNKSTNKQIKMCIPLYCAYD